MKKRAVMYGAGNIGRGFIGMLFAASGYEVVFIDVDESLVEDLREKGRYPLRYMTSSGYEDLWVEPVTAINGNERERAAEAIAECDMMATAVGSRGLGLIAPNIAAGLRRRWALGNRALNILICENLMDGNQVLEVLLKEQLTEEECMIFDERVGLVETSIGRMVPIQTEKMRDGESLRVCVERYGFLPVDRAGFKGEIPQLQKMIPFEPFDYFIRRKLYIHNMGHAVCAYLGAFLGLKYISQAIDEDEIYVIVRNAMEESAAALSIQYGIKLEELLKHIADLLYRFTNAALQDTCQRVGNDPERKLSAKDRLIGAARFAMEQGITPVYISVGAAAGIWYYIEENQGMEQTWKQAELILHEISELKPESELEKLILKMYGMLFDGKSLGEIRRAADMVKVESLQEVI